MRLHSTDKRRRAVYPLLCMAALLSACGQSGDLYLPEPAAPPQQKAQPEDSSAAQRSREQNPQDTED